jgi:hypothetical protein
MPVVRLEIDDHREIYYLAAETKRRRSCSGSLAWSIKKRSFGFGNYGWRNPETK